MVYEIIKILIYGYERNQLIIPADAERFLSEWLLGIERLKVSG